MPATVSIQENHGYIRVDVVGERTSNQEIITSAKEFWLSMLDLCDKKGVHRLLAVLNLRGNLPTLTGYELGEWVASNATKVNIRVAVVDMNAESRKINRFIEDVAVNRALDPEKAKVFDNEQSAMEWLHKDLQMTS